MPPATNDPGSQPAFSGKFRLLVPSLSLKESTPDAHKTRFKNKGEEIQSGSIEEWGAKSKANNAGFGGTDLSRNPDLPLISWTNCLTSLNLVLLIREMGTSPFQIDMRPERPCAWV